MKSERLLYSLTDINDKFIEQAVPRQKNIPYKVWLKACAIAACVAVTVAAGLAFFGKNEQPPAQLPMLTLGNIFEGGMSMEAHWAYSEEELINNNPCATQNAPEVLPVYKNSVYSENTPNYNARKMKKILLEYAEKLGINATAKDIKENTYDSFYSYYIEKGNTLIEINIWMMLNIEINQTNVLPPNCTLDHYAPADELKKTAEYLKNEYADFLDMDQPIADISGGDYDVYGRRSFSLSFYDGAGDISEQIDSYNFEKVHFWFDDSFGKLHISRSCSEDKIMGIYPIITADEALGLLLNGNYVTSVYTEFGGKEKVKKVELVYHISNLSELFVPYYKFYVEIENDGDIAENFPGMKTYGTYYVPAVESKYISTMPLWDGSIN